MSSANVSEGLDISAATPDQVQRANNAVEANLIDGAPIYESAQGYACALTAIMQTDATLSPPLPSTGVERLKLRSNIAEAWRRFGGICRLARTGEGRTKLLDAAVNEAVALAALPLDGGRE